MGTVDEIYRQILQCRRDHVEPKEIRLGAETFYELVRAMDNPYTGPLQMSFNDSAEMRVFGVPIKRLPIARAISVI